MYLLDKIKERLTPDTSNAPIATTASGGIGNRRGTLGFEDDMIVSKPAIVCHSSQIFFSFLAMCCFASVASFQARFHVGPSGLSGFALFVSIMGMFLALFLLLVPLASEKFDKFTRLARAIREDRATFVLVGTGTTLTFLLAFITTISVWSQAGCKNAKNDPHAKELGDDFTSGLPGWCATKKAGAIFFWFATGFWAGSLTLAVLQWRKNRSSRPRDLPFEQPADAEGDEESAYEVPGSWHSSPGGYNIPSAPQPRPSLDAYGAFSDPAPSGFGASPGNNGVTGVSRTMQYANVDPYAAVRASIASESTAPPSYQ
ncbi:hypothetical protein BC826DRAFT_1020304 [Russula brevipes]|nr:hypothetical protein BC826DRAFT_1020304 [Russula brevipes]